VKVSVVGAAGMIGRKLVERLASDGAIAGTRVSSARLIDAIAPSTPPACSFPVACQTIDIAAPRAGSMILEERPDVIFLLASVVSGEAEADFDKGYHVNLDGTRALFDAIRQAHDASRGAFRPRVVFTSSIAVFGAPFPEEIDDEFFATPLTSYGTQKAICELLLSDYSRRRFFEGVGVRLPTICVRPGAPNRAASGFFSSIIREPLAGKEPILPVADSVRHYHASPRSAVSFLLHAASLDLTRLGARRNLTMPGLSVTVAEQIEALRAVAGDVAIGRIKRRPDETIERIVAGWPRRFNAERASSLGFKAETDFKDIIRAYIEDEHVALAA